MALLKHESDWLDSYKRTLGTYAPMGFDPITGEEVTPESYDEYGDIDKQLKLLQGAPSLSGASNEYASALAKHRRSFFDSHVASNYSEKDRGKAYEAFSRNLSLPNAHPDTIAAAAKANPMPQTTADAVRTSSKKEIKPSVQISQSNGQQAPIQQKSIADQMREDMIKRGQTPAQDAENELKSGLDAVYSKAYGKDISTAAGRKSSTDDALARMRPNAMTGNRVGQYQENGKTQYYSLDDPRIKQNIYDNLKFGEDATWVGNNPFTGEYMDPDGNKWDSADAYKQSGMARYDMSGKTQDEISMPQNNILSPQERVDSADYIRLAQQREGDARRYDAARNADASADDAKLQSAGKARLRAIQAGDDSLNNVTWQQYHSPDFLHWTKGNAVNDLGIDPSGNPMSSAGHQLDSYNNVSGFTAPNGLGVNQNWPWTAPQMSMPKMPTTDIADAIRARSDARDRRSFDNATNPFSAYQPATELQGRPLNLNVNRPNFRARIPTGYPQFK